MTPRCPFLPPPPSLQRAAVLPPAKSMFPPHLPTTRPGHCSNGRGKMGRGDLGFHPGHSCPTFIRENQIAAAAAAEINGNWQENLLFFQSWISPSKHKDRVENGRHGGVGV